MKSNHTNKTFTPTVKGAINKAINLRTKFPYVYKTDIISFFDKIDRCILKEKIKKKIKQRSIHNILFKMIDCEIYTPDRNKLLKIESAGIKTGIGLRQGMPISPYLSNLMLYDFDLQLKAKGVKCVRYADDLIAFGASKEECKKYEEIIKDSLNKINLNIPSLNDHNSKSKILKPSEDVDFLGMGIALIRGEYKAIITNKQLESTHKKLTEYSNLEFCMLQGITLGGVISHIESLRNVYNNYYDNCAESSKFHLNKIFKENTYSIVESLVRKAIYKDFSIKNLTYEQRKFLGIDYLVLD